jgi:hypothetical protein
MPQVQGVPPTAGDTRWQRELITLGAVQIVHLGGDAHGNQINIAGAQSS